MGALIHARRRNGEFVYREWHTATDSYTTPELGLEAIIDRSLVDYTVRDLSNGLAATLLAQRIERANVSGSSAYHMECPEDLDGPWDAECCQRCGVFHHAWVPSPHNGKRCDTCGEPEHRRSHGAPCR